MIVACIPAYNEEKTIARVILLAQKHVDAVIVCDDGSTDLTADIAQRLGASVIRHERNLGYGAAIRTLFMRAEETGADVTVTLDADGQHDALEIPKLIAPILQNEADIVIGSRFLKKNNDIPSYRRFGIKIITKLSGNAGKTGLSDAQSGFRAYSRKAIQTLRLYEEGMGISAEILMKAGEQGFRICEVPVEVQYRGLETSTHNPLRHGVNVLGTIIKLVVEERPLFYLGIPGTVLFITGLGLYILHSYLSFTTSPWDTSARLGLLPYLFVALGFMLLGIFALFASVTLYAIVRLSQKQEEYLKRDREHQ